MGSSFLRVQLHQPDVGLCRSSVCCVPCVVIAPISVRVRWVRLPQFLCFLVMDAWGVGAAGLGSRHTGISA